MGLRGGAQRRAREAIEKRVETIATKQDGRVQALVAERAALALRIEALMQNLTLANTALSVVNQCLASGMQWSALEEQVRLFRQQPYNLFHHICALDLEHNRMRLEFRVAREADEEAEDEADEAEEEAEEERVTVEVDLSCNANRNVEQLYARCREVDEKLEKTREAAEKAVKAASKQVCVGRRGEARSRRSCAWRWRSRPRCCGGGRRGGSRSSTGS